MHLLQAPCYKAHRAHFRKVHLPKGGMQQQQQQTCHPAKHVTIRPELILGTVLAILAFAECLTIIVSALSGSSAAASPLWQHKLPLYVRTVLAYCCKEVPRPGVALAGLWAGSAACNTPSARQILATKEKQPSGSSWSMIQVSQDRGCTLSWAPSSSCDPTGFARLHGITCLLGCISNGKRRADILT